MFCIYRHIVDRNILIDMFWLTTVKFRLGIDKLQLSTNIFDRWWRLPNFGRGSRNYDWQTYFDRWSTCFNWRPGNFDYRSRNWYFDRLISITDLKISIDDREIAIGDRHISINGCQILIEDRLIRNFYQSAVIREHKEPRKFKGSFREKFSKSE